MPEWPDLEVLKERLGAALVGATCTGARVVRPTVLRLPVPGTLHEALAGRRVRAVQHRGKFLMMSFSARSPELDVAGASSAGGAGLAGGAPEPAKAAGPFEPSDPADPPVPVPCLVMNLMVTGSFELVQPADKLDRETCLVLEFARSLGDGGSSAGSDSDWTVPQPISLRYVDEKQMGKVYWVPEAAFAGIVAGWKGLGPEADLRVLDEDQWVRRARGYRHEVRNLLMHQEFIAGIGNAYAGETLWWAGLHPKRAVRSLSDEELRRLYRVVRDLMAEALQEARAHLPANLKAKVRHFFGVRGHAGEACPCCGTRIVRRSLGYLEADFCPKCQPAPAGQIY